MLAGWSLGLLGCPGRSSWSPAGLLGFGAWGLWSSRGFVVVAVRRRGIGSLWRVDIGIPVGGMLGILMLPATLLHGGPPGVGFAMQVLDFLRFQGLENLPQD